MNFREQLLADRDAFLDPGELADTIEIEGRVIEAVVRVTDRTADDFYGQEVEGPGVHVPELVVTARTEDLPALRPDQQVAVDCVYCTVKAVVPLTGGMTRATFIRNDS